MSFPSRRQQGLGDAFTDALGLDDGSASDIDPSTIALATTSMGTFSTPAPAIVQAVSPTYAPVTAAGLPYVAPAAPTTAQTVQGIASTATGLTSIFSSISNLFAAKPATSVPISAGGVAAPVTTAPSTIGGISTSTLLIFGLIGGAALLLTVKAKKATRRA